jgi:hypothetical protein
MYCLCVEYEEMLIDSTVRNKYFHKSPTFLSITYADLLLHNVYTYSSVDV